MLRCVLFGVLFVFFFFGVYRLGIEGWATLHLHFDISMRPYSIHIVPKVPVYHKKGPPFLRPKYTRFLGTWSLRVFIRFNHRAV